MNAARSGLRLAIALGAGLGLISLTAPAGAEEVRKDPKGVRGISPFWEAIKTGDAAYVARDFAAAITAYQRAIELMPQNALGHYRMGQALVANGAPTEAEEAYKAALRYATDPVMKAKASFVLADLKERQRDLPAATEGWAAYATAAQEKGAKAYPATAEARPKVITRWQELEAEYAKVKERIATRVSEADKSLQKSSK